MRAVDPAARIVRLEHLGTHVDIWSDLDREATLTVVEAAPAMRPTPMGEFTTGDTAGAAQNR